MTIRRACPVCGLVYERGPGDTWAFWVIGDRIPIGVGVVAAYFGVAGQSRAIAVAIFGAIVVSLIATIPQRLGLVVALDYLSRRYWPDPADVLPPIKREVPS